MFILDFLLRSLSVYLTLPSALPTLSYSHFYGARPSTPISVHSNQTTNTPVPAPHPLQSTHLQSHHSAPGPLVITTRPHFILLDQQHRVQVHYCVSVGNRVSASMYTHRKLMFRLQRMWAAHQSLNFCCRLSHSAEPADLQCDFQWVHHHSCSGCSHIFSFVLCFLSTHSEIPHFLCEYSLTFN